MSTSLSPLRINGAELIADLSGALFWCAEKTLAVADLHFGKGTRFAQHGIHLPPYDTRTTLDRLAQVIRRFDPRRVICLGDSFDDDGAESRIDPEDASRLGDLASGREWIWLAGNHDPSPPATFGGQVMAEWHLGPLLFRHEAASTTEPGELSGHYHPKASCLVRGRRVADRCFVGDGRRMILPAFGAYAGGLDVLDPVIDNLFPDGFVVLMLGGQRIHELPRGRLRPPLTLP